MITGGLGWDLPSAQARAAKGRLSRNTSRSSEGVSIASRREATVCPSVSRFIQRWIEAAQVRRAHRRAVVEQQAPGAA